MENILKDIGNYREEMTISQVVRYFERQGVSFTKTMIQNYVRVGLIPPPVNKRYYNRGHVALLAFVDILKDAYTLEQIDILLSKIKGEETEAIVEAFGEFAASFSACEEELNKKMERAGLRLASQVTALKKASLSFKPPACGKK